MVYRSGQFEVVYPFLLETTPEWLLLGGPADGDEAQCAVERWPDIGVIGAEPNLEMWEYQHPIWPKKGTLHRAALSDKLGLANLRVPYDPRCSTLKPENPGGDQVVVCLSVDRIVENNQMDRIILWLDIEGWEYRVLQGARKSFEEGKILLVNVEVMDREVEKGVMIDEFMEGYNFEKVYQWSSDRDVHPHWDKIYRLRGVR